MRQRQQRIVITFHTTTQAMAAEKEFQEQGIGGRLIPVPVQISSGCGLAWSAPLEEKEVMEQCIKLCCLDYQQMDTLSI